MQELPVLTSYRLAAVDDTSFRRRAEISWIIDELSGLLEDLTIMRSASTVNEALFDAGSTCLSRLRFATGGPVIRIKLWIKRIEKGERYVH